MDLLDVPRRCIARIHFKWKNALHPDPRSARDEIDMVLPGVIVSVENGKCIMIVDPSFFRDKTRFSFYVSLPREDGGYDDGVLMNPRKKDYLIHQEFYAFLVKSNNYVAAATLDKSPVKQSDPVFSFLFARELAISTAYCAGHIVASAQSQVDMEVVFHDCPQHEYGHYGSPIFNKDGLLVGICYSTQSRIHSWTIYFLKKQLDLLKKRFDQLWNTNCRITYVCSDQERSHEGPPEVPNQQGDPNQQGASNPSTSSLSVPLDSAASDVPPPPSSCLGIRSDPSYLNVVICKDMDPGNVPHHVAKRSRIDGSVLSSSIHAAPLPSGVVTLGCKKNSSSPMLYFTGIIIMCERGLGNEYTTYILSSQKATYDSVSVYFEPTIRAEAEFCAAFSRHMIVSVKHDQFHEPLTWSRKAVPGTGYQLVKSMSIMVGTKLNDSTSAPIIRPLIGLLGLYNGQIITPRCHAAAIMSHTVLSGTEEYFQFSCSYQDAFINFSNVDLDKDTTYACDSMLSAPVFNLKGDFVGIVVSRGNWPDTKAGIYAERLLPIVETLMNKFYEGWSNEMLKWSSEQSV